ncbi:Hypothetical protein NTJ_02800 [Nesidiocoris tenuis]|uniref:Uncharacterized protein n=1 Tax=Nesidiocoris tenuis TaxID=355587 RepID=A0ABN7ADD6_9HEMI|nr:Hypothetical protein NTJ_02800 [Nesidiocoris tenuis]
MRAPGRTSVQRARARRRGGGTSGARERATRQRPMARQIPRSGERRDVPERDGASAGERARARRNERAAGRPLRAQLFSFFLALSRFCTFTGFRRRESK